MSLTKENLPQFFESRKQDLKVAMAEVELTEFPGNMQGVMITKHQAQERLAEGWHNYLNYATEHAGLIVLRGSLEDQAAFAKMAEEVGGTATIDTNKLFLDLTLTAYLYMAGGTEAGVNQISYINSELRSFTRQNLGWFRFRPPELLGLLSIPIKSHQDMASYVRGAIRYENGNVLLDRTVFTELTNQGIEKELATSILPAVLVGVEEVEVPQLSATVMGRLVEVEVKPESTKEDVISAFMALKNRVRELNPNQ